MTNLFVLNETFTNVLNNSWFDIMCVIFIMCLISVIGVLGVKIYLSITKVLKLKSNPVLDQVSKEH